MNRNISEEQREFDALFLKYYPGLVRFSKSLMNSGQAEAEDVVQDVFLKFWQRRKGVAIHTGMASYLYTAVKNGICDLYRKKKITTYDPVDFVDDQQADYYLEPDRLLMFKQLHLDVDQMIAMLPERTQLVFRMSREDQLSYEQIAQLLGISVNSVKTHMYRAIKFLKEAFERYNSLI